MYQRRLFRSYLLLRRRVRAAFASIFGSLHVAWSPPAWIGAVGRHSRLIGLLLVFAIVAGMAGQRWWRWREAHRPRPRELVATRTVNPLLWTPAEPSIDKTTGTWNPSPLKIDFSADAARLALIGKTATPSTARLSPERPGKWTWRSARTLIFLPEAPWPAGIKYTVSLDASQLAEHTLLERQELEFTTRSLSASFTKPEFYTDPTDPTLHQAVVTATVSQPVDIAEFRRNLEVSVLGDPALLGAGVPEILPDREDPNRFFIRSPRIIIPKDDAFVRFRIATGLTPQAGGKPFGSDVIEKVAVPTRTTGFHIAGANAKMVPDEEGEPQQFIFVDTRPVAEQAVFAKAVEAWQLPKPESVDFVWAAADITPEVLARSKRIPLEPVTDEKAAPLASSFAFKLPPTSGGPLLVRVPKDTPAPGGFVLARDFATLVEVPAFSKEVKLLGDGGVLALNGERKLTIKSRGFSHLRATLARVPAGQINHLASQAVGDFQSPEFKGWTFGFHNLAHFHRSVQTIAKKNDHTASYSSFDFGPALASEDKADPDHSRGLFFLSIEGVRHRTPDDEEEKGDPDPEWIALNHAGSDIALEDEENNDASDSRFILITDLGLLVKRSADGTREVFVHSFSERAPVEGVAITALATNGEPLAEGKTGPDGHVSLPALDGLLREKKPVAIVARKGNDVAFIPWARDNREVELTRFNIDGVPASEGDALDAFLFTERGIYRPGDSIKVGAIVRQRDWGGDIAGIPVEAAVFNAKEEAAGVFPANLSPDGFLEFSIPTAETAPTGVWRIELRRQKKDGRKNDEERHLGHTLVRVEDFQPDRMKMAASLEPATKGGWLSPEKLTAHADLQTLFGAPAADRRVTARMRIAPGEAQFDAWKDWQFHLPGDNHFEGREIEIGETKTDDAGHAQFELALNAFTAPLLRVVVELEGFEPDGGRGVRGIVSTLVSRQSRLVGWRADGDLDYIGRDVPRTLRLVALTPDLQPVAAPGLHRLLIETRHVSVLTKQENGSLAYVSRPQDKTIERVDIDLPATESTLALPTERAGRFRYEWQDDSGAALCVVSFNVVGPGDPTRNLERDTELEMALPSREWRAGEQLEVSLRAPYTGGGLITIEREKVFGWQWFKADSASSVQHITVPPDLEGGAYVHVDYVRGLDSPEIFTNPLSVGVQPFRFAPDRRKMDVTLDAPALVRPGTPLHIGFRSARPGRAIVWAVDEGIHRVTRYRSPEPLAFLLRQRSLEVQTWQLVDLLLPEFSLLKKSRAYGGDGDAPELQLGLNPFKRRHDAPVVFWSGLVACGPERHEVTYDVPDYFAGRLNIMAIALAPDAVGGAEVKTVVKGPFVLTPNVPLFATPGDEFIASLTVANQLEGDAVTDSITVAAESIGGLEIVEAPHGPVTIKPGTDTTVRFRVRVKDALGNAELKFSAAGGNERVELRSSLSVRPATPFVTDVQSGWFRQDHIDLPAGRSLYSEFSGREATVSTTPLGLARGLGAYLREYPHGCSEQITSRAFPWLVLRDDADFGLAPEEAGRVVEHTMAMLARRQSPDGGFGYWTSADGRGGFDYLTIYVAHFLTEAKACGFDVPATLMESTLHRLKAMAAAPVRTRAEADIQAAAIYLLTRHEVVTTNYALNLTDTLDHLAKKEWQRDLSAAWLAATWRLLKKDNEALKLIALHRKARATSPARSGANYYESPLTDAAQSFVVICRHFPEIASDFGYDDLKPITEPISRGEFHTLSASWSVLALKAYARLAKDSGLKVGISESVAGKLRSIAEPRLSLTSARFAPEADGLRFLLARPSGSPDLGAWYQTIQAGFDRRPPAQASTRGIEVFREFLDSEGHVVTTAKVGDTLRMRVRLRNVNARAQDHLAITDLFPGGFDLAPNGLKPGLSALPGAEYVDVREDRALLFCELDAGESRTFEYKVRPLCAGTFVVPPAFAENMYDRAVHGSGAAGKFIVQPRE